MQWETVIGLEIHVQLNTASKMFSGAATAYGASPNTQACAVDLGLPGVLPVINAEALRKAIKFGLAVDAHIAGRSVFARKNYFYPDLPKGYQISQYELPIVSRGRLAIRLDDGAVKIIGITRAHLEEDAGKSLHEDFHGMSGIDLNRAGTPLLEIVSEPDLRSAAEAVTYMRKIHQLVRWLGISDGNMQEGSFRCDANVSLRHPGETRLGTRTEIKNLNSFRFVEQAILHETDRQSRILQSGGMIVQETRLYDPQRDETRPMRSKEEANDYRYFPDPDLLPVKLDADFLADVRASMPEILPDKAWDDVKLFGLSDQDAAQVSGTPCITSIFMETARMTGDPKLTANTVIGEVIPALNRDGIDLYAVRDPKRLAQDLNDLLRFVMDGTISYSTMKQVYQWMRQGEGTAGEIINKRGLRQESDTGVITGYVDQVIAANPEQVAQFRAGKEKVLAFLVGQVMKKSQGKANPQQVNEILRDKLKQ